MRPHALVLVAAAACLAACGAPSQTRTMTLEAPGPAEHLAVDVENFRGNVEVFADARRENIEVQTTIVASRDVPKENLPQVFESVAVNSAIEIEPAMGAGFNTLRVRTASLRPGASDVSANVVVRVPRCDGVRVLNTRGFVELVDVGGALEVNNVDGAILVRTTRALTEPVTLLTSNGSIYCQAPQGTTGDIDLHAIDGVLAFKDAFGSSTNTRHAPQHLSAQLGDGDNPIVMRTNEGQVRLLIMEDPLAFTRAIKTPPPSIWDSLYLQGSRRYTLNLPDDAGTLDEAQAP